jgi:uncharacterized protein YrrD
MFQATSQQYSVIPLAIMDFYFLSHSIESVLYLIVNKNQVFHHNASVEVRVIHV